MTYLLKFIRITMFVSASFLGLMLVVTPLQAAKSKQHKRHIVGWVENVRMDEVDLTLLAKMDTGAKTSSLSANVIGYKENANAPKNYTDQTVIFSVLDENSKQERVFERDVVRFVRIKLKEGGFHRRPVVQMGFCVAKMPITAEVNLTDRSHFNYALLVGRNVLSKAKLLVDPKRQKLSAPHCKAPKAGQ
jgi:hypothetical protein